MLCSSRQDGSLCDLTLIVDDVKEDSREGTEKVYVHKLILFAASPFMKSLYLEGKLQADIFEIKSK